MAQQAPPHLLFHWRPHFPNRCCSCCSVLAQFPGKSGFPWFFWAFLWSGRLPHMWDRPMLLPAAGNCFLDMCLPSSLCMPLLIMAVMLFLGFCLIGIIIKGNWRQPVSTNTQGTVPKHNQACSRLLKHLLVEDHIGDLLVSRWRLLMCMLWRIVWPCWPFVSLDNITAVQETKQTRS